MDKKVALVTGANRGIGLETSRQLARLGYHVVMACRSEGAGADAVAGLSKEGLDVSLLVCDVSDPSSVEKARKEFEKKHDKLHALVNNAGILPDGHDGEPSSVFEARRRTLLRAFETNTLGPWEMTRTFVPLMRKAGSGRVVNVSSGMGQLTGMNGGSPAYRLSKTALNALTNIFADELRGTGILVNSVCPGWVKTDMGGPGADREVEKGAETIVWLATLPEGAETGGFYKDKKRIPW